MFTHIGVNVLNINFGIPVPEDVEISLFVSVDRSLMPPSDVFVQKIITGLDKDVSTHHVSVGKF